MITGFPASLQLATAMIAVKIRRSSCRGHRRVAVAWPDQDCYDSIVSVVRSSHR